MEKQKVEVSIEHFWVKINQGLEGGALIPHSHPFFARIPHPARFSSVSRIPPFFR